VLPTTSGVSQKDEIFGVSRAHGIGAGVNAFDPGVLERCIDLDRHDLGMRAVGPHEMRVKLSAKVPVRSKGAAAGDQAFIFDPHRGRGIAVRSVSHYNLFRMSGDQRADR